MIQRVSLGIRIDQILSEVTLSTNFFNDKLSTLIKYKKGPPQLKENIVIYGAGNFGKEVFRLLTVKGHKVVAFLDIKAARGDQWNGVPIHQPDLSDISSEQKKRITVLVAVHNPDSDMSPILRLLKKQGYIQILNPVEFFELYPAELGDRFWLTSPNSYQDWPEQILQAYKIWEDDSSRSLYLSLFHLRLQGDYSVLPAPDATHQYFPQDIPEWENPLRFVDCGAYDGDTLRALKDGKFVFESIVAFEPDLQNFWKLSDFISRDWNSPALLFPCGVYSTTKQLFFSNGGGESGKVINSRNNVIQGVTLSDALHGFHPNLIKMDIEGAEFEGLLGARKIIENDRPGLAISVYHKPQHLWQIPLMINRWDLDYKFYLRSHAYNGFDVVMYALAT